MSYIESVLILAYPVVMNDKNIEIRQAFWESDLKYIQDVRTRVFVQEQGVPIELECDGNDPQMTHVLAFVNSHAAGTARMSPQGHIGRVAVLYEYRKNNIGTLLMEALENLAVSFSMDEVSLNAQTQAMGFYKSCGYKEEGEIFEEAGISHIHMKKKIVKTY
ncbi:GNAT family N-acetyltransferase [Oceanispirochaeta crateris]|uniref:GNAT family N-acetyltransferase n=1 Tax=Oceanispirochaeta crateris TaxID=2518645 RepID=A0A5C1QKS8_9SPIO|nr:GNAT family N-acetyltransferase [Oceanispirochaeta crateris]QEN07136.1 GNAT family N-acetyltransferase [Oceanispirochaeta crateris]